MGGRTDKLTYSWDGAFLIEVAAPQSYWVDAVTYVVYMINRMLSKMLDFHTPLDVLTDHVSLPSSLNLTSRIFGCVAYVHLHKNQRTKLNPCAVKLFFWALLHSRNATNVIILRPINSVSLWILHSHNQKFSFLLMSLIVSFRGKQLMNDRFGTWWRG